MYLSSTVFAISILSIFPVISTFLPFSKSIIIGLYSFPSLNSTSLPSTSKSLYFKLSNIYFIDFFTTLFNLAAKTLYFGALEKIKFLFNPNFSFIISSIMSFVSSSVKNFILMFRSLTILKKVSIVSCIKEPVSNESTLKLSFSDMFNPYFK